MNQRSREQAPIAPAGGELGLWMSTALVVGNVIGMGIFLLPAGLAPYGLNALVGWAIMLLGCVALARVFAALAREFPESDGPYTTIKSQLGEAAAFLTIWCYWVSVWCTNAVLAVGVVGYLAELVPPLAAVPPAIIGLALVWLFVGVNLLGVRTGGGVQVATTVLKILPLAAVILLGVWLLFASPEVYAQAVPATPLTLGGIMAASTTALYAMLGFESAAVPAGRVKNPAVIIPRATLVGTVVTAAIYIAASTIPMFLIPQGELAVSKAPFVELLNRWLADGSGRLLAVFVVVSGVGCLNGWTLLAGEVTRILAVKGTLPSLFGRVNRHGAPTAALIGTGLLASGMVLMNYSDELVKGFVFLTNVVTAAALPLYFLSSLALGWLWFGRKDRGGLRLPILAALGAGYSVFAIIGMGQKPFLWALALAGAGVVVYVLMRWGRERRRWAD